MNGTVAAIAIIAIYIIATCVVLRIFYELKRKPPSKKRKP